MLQSLGLYDPFLLFATDASLSLGSFLSSLLSFSSSPGLASFGTEQPYLLMMRPLMHIKTSNLSVPTSDISEKPSRVYLESNICVKSLHFLLRSRLDLAMLNQATCRHALYARDRYLLSLSTYLFSPFVLSPCVLAPYPHPFPLLSSEFTRIA